MLQHCRQYCRQYGNCTVYQHSETVARNTAEVDYDSTSTSATLHETTSRGGTSIASIVCNNLSILHNALTL